MEINYNQYLSEITETQILDKEALENFKNKWLSKKGIVSTLLAGLRDVPNELKKDYGAQINLLKQLATDKYEALFQHFEELSYQNANAGIDFTLDGDINPIGGLHPLTIVKNKITKIFKSLGFVVEEGNEIVDDWHNFTALNMPESHPARDMQDTFFIQQNPDIVLRTHTSSVQVKTMQNQPPPIRIIAPGRVFRKDNDSTHSPNFHQVEGLYIDKDVSFKHLKETLYYFVQEMFGEGTKVRFRASFFPFTEPSAEMDILWRKYNPETDTYSERWMEILGCGMVDPTVLDNCGIDSEQFTGFAFGMGIERITMVKYGLSDIRALYENDLRFLKQFNAEVL